MHFLTDEEAGARLHRSAGQVRYLRRTGRLRFLRGQPVRIPEGEIDRFLRAELERSRAQSTDRGGKGEVPDAFQRALKARAIRKLARGRD